MTTYAWDTGTNAQNAVTGYIDQQSDGNPQFSRWWWNYFSCDTLYPIICYVNP
jgi:hypothetical protein